MAKVKNQVTEDAGKNVERKENFLSVGGIVSWYNHSVKQSGGFAEN